MRGIPGSGKSTVAKKLAENGGVIHSVEHSVLENESGLVLERDKLLEQHDPTFAAFEDSLKQNKEIVVVDHSNICEFEFERYLEVCVYMLELYGPLDCTRVQLHRQRRADATRFA